MKSNNWYKPRGYTHFTKKLTIGDAGYVNSYVSDSKNVSKHSFFPLIHRTIAEKRYKKINTDKGIIRSHHYRDKDNKKISTVKYREIFYANHMDAHIYSYYAKNVLGPKYEELLESSSSINDAVLAYRSIKCKGEDRNKCNVDFAKEVFDIIKEGKGEVSVLAFDVSKFFDSLNHKILKRKWCSLLGEKSLPDDHFKIYRSLIRFSYVEMKDVLLEFGYKHPNIFIEKNIPCLVKNASEFREKVIKKGYVKTNPFRRNSDIVGIPQGTPISAFLANLYMYDYDKKVVDFLNPINGTYRRYSDDILVICPTDKKEVVNEFILNAISEYELSIQSEKTQISNFKDAKLLQGEKPVQYLGFEFDGKKIRLKSSSISKYYRKAKRFIRYKAGCARKAKYKNRERGFIFKKEIYCGYTHLGATVSSNRKRNYLSYVNLASRIMNDKGVKRQLAKSWDIVEKEIQKYESRYNLLSSKK